MLSVWRVCLVSTLALFTGCSQDVLLNLPNIGASGSPQTVSSLISAAARLSRQRVKVRFLNRLSNGEVVPLVPAALESLRFNGQFSLDLSAFPANKGLEQDFPFIEPGEHVIELLLRNQDEPVKVPIVVTRDSDTEQVILVILAFDGSGNQIRDVQVGYDQDGDARLDTNRTRYRSSNGISYLVTTPDGRTEAWTGSQTRADSNGNAVAGDAPLPPGTERVSPLDNGNPLPQDTASQAPLPPIDVPKLPDPRPVPLPVPGA
ncbi:MAG: hypothetical protein ACO1RX_03255 [Candidatus Sericytochromatia bacterium]